MTEQLTTKEAAEILEVSVYTIMNYIKTGLLPAEKVNTHTGKGHTKYLIDRNNVQALRSLRMGGGIKPGPQTGRNKGNKGRTVMYLPRPVKWGEEIKGTLNGEERAQIMEHYARKKRQDPEGFREELSKIF